MRTGQRMRAPRQLGNGARVARTTLIATCAFVCSQLGGNSGKLTLTLLREASLICVLRSHENSNSHWRGRMATGESFASCVHESAKDKGLQLNYSLGLTEGRHTIITEIADTQDVRTPPVETTLLFSPGKLNINVMLKTTDLILDDLSLVPRAPSTRLSTLLTRVPFLRCG